MMNWKITFFHLFLLFTISISAQDASSSFTIKGQVTDSLTDESVPYATLRIAPASQPQQPIKLLACNEEGLFNSSLKEEGTYILTIESIGMATTQKKFKLSSGHNQMDFGKILMHEDTEILGEVTVTAQKPLVKVDVDKLTYSMEDDPEATTSNALDMFRKVPLVTLDGDDQIQLKGSSNYKIYINGKPSNLLSGTNASDVLKSMPASSIKNIEVITDPGAKYDAEGIGGIINIITTRNAMQGYSGSVRANASTLGSFGGGAYFSIKAGKLGLTANYGYRQRNAPWTDSYAERITDNDHLTGGSSLLKETGRNKNKGPFQFGNVEASYEIDSLNLLSVSMDLHKGRKKNISELTAMLDTPGTGDIDHHPFYRYQRNSTSEGSFGSTDIHVDYQHSTIKKGELLTLSYLFSRSPNDNDSYTELKDAYHYFLSDEYPKRNTNDAATIEHTAQVDYTTPLLKGQTLEVGAKYINRQNNSTTLEEIYNDSTRIWEDHSRTNSDFKHIQHIYSAYLGHLIKLKKFGIKTGVRAEGTSLNAEFAKDHRMDFKTNYFDIVPNITLTYQPAIGSQLRLGYNLRIERPSIRYLNPFINDVNPQNITQGNPNLDSEKSNNINLNYSLFSQKFSINASLSYTFINNSIESYSFIADFPAEDIRSPYNGALWNTYGNIGKKQKAGVYVYGNWSPSSWFRITLNANLDYTDLKSKSRGLENNGWSGGFYAGPQFTLPAEFRFNVHGGYFSPRILLQGKQSPYYFTSIKISKDFMQKKLSLSVGLQNPFWKEIKMENETFGEGFYNTSTSWRPSREVRFTVSYRFGTLKDKIKKVSRSITNDDSKSEEQNKGMEGGEMGM